MLLSPHPSTLLPDENNMAVKLKRLTVLLRQAKHPLTFYVQMGCQHKVHIKMAFIAKLRYLSCQFILKSCNFHCYNQLPPATFLHFFETNNPVHGKRMDSSFPITTEQWIQCIKQNYTYVHNEKAAYYPVKEK